MSVKILSRVFAAAVVMFAASCSDNDGGGDPGQVDNLPANRAVVLNTGAYGYNNANLSVFLPGDPNSPVYADYFMTQNGFGLGDMAQDLIEHNGYMYVSVFNSNYVARINKSCKEEARVSFVSDPDLTGGVRELTASGSYIYASFYGGYVAKLNATTLEVVAKLKLPGGNLEQIVNTGGKLYVADSYEVVLDPATGNYVYNYLTSVYVVDIATFGLVETVTVDINPNFLAVADGKVYVISAGDYATSGYSLQAIDPAHGNAVTRLGVATDMGVGNGRVYLLNSVSDWSSYPFTTTNTWFSYDCATGQIFNSSFLVNAPEPITSGNISLIKVDDATGDIYIAVTNYSVANGDIYRFDKNGNYLGVIDSGGQNPTRLVFFK